MTGKPAEQWYTVDWFRSVDVRKCSWATRGMWVEMLNIMINEKEQGKIHGKVQEICKLVGCTCNELVAFIAENRRHKFANIKRRNGYVTIINRRMYNAFLERERTKERVKKYREGKRNADVTDKKGGPCNANVTGLLQSSTSTSIDIDQKSKKQRLIIDAQKLSLHLSERLDEKFIPSPKERKTIAQVVRNLQQAVIQGKQNIGIYKAAHLLIDRSLTANKPKAYWVTSIQNLLKRNPKGAKDGT